MEELIECLKEYCKKELEEATYGANKEKLGRTDQNLEHYLPEYLSKLYYRSIAAIEKYNALNRYRQ